MDGAGGGDRGAVVSVSSFVGVSVDFLESTCTVSMTGGSLARGVSFAGRELPDESFSDLGEDEVFCSADKLWLEPLPNFLS